MEGVQRITVVYPFAKERKTLLFPIFAKASAKPSNVPNRTASPATKNVIFKYGSKLGIAFHR